VHYPVQDPLQCRIQLAVARLMRRVLVTGASGFIGHHVAVALHHRGIAVRATGRDPAALARLPDGIERMPGDLRSTDAAALLRGCDAVVHSAARSSPWGTAHDFQADNVDATSRLLQAALAAGVGRFVHFSSPTIYFSFSDQLQRREDFTAPARWITHYARSKWEGELRVRDAAAQGLPALVLRPRAVLGDGDRAVLPRAMAMARRGVFPLIGGGQAWVDITAVDNVVDATLAALQADAALADGRAYNITNGEPIQVATLFEQVFAHAGLQPRRLHVPRQAARALGAISEGIARRRPGCPEPGLTRYAAGVLGWSQTLDIGRARHELGYAPRLDNAATVQRAVQAIQAVQQS